METRILLGSARSAKSTNENAGLNVNVTGRRRLLPTEDVSEVISQQGQYLSEREACNKIRLTCQLNTVCSNVLFNHITEIVKDEGSPDVKSINYGVLDFTQANNKGKSFWTGSDMQYYQGGDDEKYGTLGDDKIMHPTNSIRDMSITMPSVGFVYHCGLDVFNNHLIRSNTFRTVCRSDSIKDSFNTIADTMRDVKGADVKETLPFPESARVPDNQKNIKLHLYTQDYIDTFSDCVSKRLVKGYDGWVGFYNRGKIKSYDDFINDKVLWIDRPLMYKNAGDFVDMYPGRELYSPLPIYNPYRKRIEKNWHCCVTYPSSSYTPTTAEVGKPTPPFSDIIESSNGVNSLKTVYFDENTRADNGVSQVVMYGISKHGLSEGDRVNIYKTYDTHLYWLVDKPEGSVIRVSRKYDTAEAAKKEAFEKYGKTGLTITDEVNSGSTRTLSVIRSKDITTTTKRVIDEAAVTNVVDDFIFTVSNSSTRISDTWVYPKDSEKDEFKATVDGTEYAYRISENYRYYEKGRYSGGEWIKTENSPRYYLVNGKYVNIDDTAQRVSYKKTVGGIECDYYVRIFSKVPNFKFAGGYTHTADDIYADNMSKIREYQDIRYDFENHVSRLAFANNIYSDEIGEIVFTDDIDISNLHDNLGRPLSSIYLTFIKNNRGYKEWYGYDTSNTSNTNPGTGGTVFDISSEKVEYSHAFGRVTCGIKTSYESSFEMDINSINRITNIGEQTTEGFTYPLGYDVDGTINTGRTAVDTNIYPNEVWYDTDKDFYGDLCCFDNYNSTETHIEYVEHRFNTAQRESALSKKYGYYSKYQFDEFKCDDYDATKDGTVIVASGCGYTCNSFKEGYYYNPHYEIPIRTFGELKTIMPDFLTTRELRQSTSEKRITTREDHYLSGGDTAMVYNSSDGKYYLLKVTGVPSYKEFTFEVYDDNGDELLTSGITYTDNIDREKTIEYMSTSVSPSDGDIQITDLILFKTDNLSSPGYAKVLKDGTCRLIWRDIINNGFDSGNDSIEEYPFTNGAFYVNRRVDLFVRRQDPESLYRLYQEADVEGVAEDIDSENNYIREDEIEC